MNFKSIEICTY